MECQVWGLERYAKLTSQITPGAAGQDGWEVKFSKTKRSYISIFKTMFQNMPWVVYIAFL